MRLGSPTRKSVKSILESGRDLRPRAQASPRALSCRLHGNVRGPATTTDDDDPPPTEKNHVDEPNDRDTQEL